MNDNNIISQLDSLNSFNKKTIFLNNNLRRLGAGSSRIVYEYDANHVIKLAKNNKGLTQNEQEVDVYLGNKSIDSITKIENYDESNYSWILAEKAVKLTPSNFKQIKGFSFSDFASYLTNYQKDQNPQKYRYFGKIKIDQNIVEIIEEDELTNDIIYLEASYGLAWGDLVRISSYGEINRNGSPDIVLVDYGYVVNESVENRVINDGGYGGFALQPQIVEESEILDEHYIKYDNLALLKSGNLYVLFDPKIKIDPNSDNYDEAFNYILGAIELRFNDKYDSFEVDSISAKHGYGPLMYMIGMTVAGSKGLIPSRINTQVTNEAKNVWKEFFNGKGTQYVNILDLKDNENQIASQHNEEYLNKKYLIKKPLQLNKLYNKTQMLLRNDQYGEKEYWLEELGNDYLRNSMRGIYGEGFTHRNNIHTPHGVKCGLKLIESDLTSHYSNSTLIEIQNAVNYINHFVSSDDVDLDNELAELYKNYLIIENNINDAIQLVENPEEFYNRLLDVQKYLKFTNLIKEDKFKDNALVESLINIEDKQPNIDKYLNDKTLNIIKHVSNGNNKHHFIDSDQNDLLITRDAQDIKNYYNQLNKSNNSFPFVIDVYKLNDVDYVVKSKSYTISNYKRNILNENIQLLKNIVKELFGLTFEQFYLIANKNPNLFKLYNDVIVDELLEVGQTKYLHNGLLNIINNLKQNEINSLDFLNPNNLSLSEGKLVLNKITAPKSKPQPINEIGNASVNIDDEMIPKVMQKFNIQNYKHIGECGEFGCAFDIGNNKVLKITTDQSEAIESNKLKGKTLNNISNIYSVFKINYNGKDYYIIQCEKLNTQPDKFKQYYNQLNDVFRKNIDIPAVDVLVDYYQEDLQAYNNEFKDDIDNFLDKNSDYGKFYQGLLNIIDELRKYSIQSSDYINYKNLGYKPNGNLGFFDVGFGDTNEKFSPEHININERKIAFMPNMQTVKVKKECAIGGNGDGTSKACNQGDIDNLELKTINENKGISNYKQVKQSIEKSRKLSKEMKEEILKYITSGSRYNEGRIYGLNIPKIEGKSFKGVSLGADKNGFFVYTHRARSKSYSEPNKIPDSKIKFVESTG